MSLKASINGPNRRRNRVGDRTIASSIDDDGTSSSSKCPCDTSHDVATYSFRVQKLEVYLDEISRKNCLAEKNGATSTISEIGDACLFTVGSNSNSCGARLIRKHYEMTEVDARFGHVGRNDPVLIHFHDIPVFLLRALPIFIDGDDHTENNDTDDIIYLSKVHCQNHKICEDTTCKVKCCSRPSQSASSNISVIRDYDVLSAVGMEVFHRHSTLISTKSNDMATYNAVDIATHLMNQTIRSVITVNELRITTVSDGTELVCRVAQVRVRRDPTSILGGTSGETMTVTEAIMDEPYRGRVDMNTEFFISPSDPSSMCVIGSKKMPLGPLPDDLVHITTSDLEWFPVRRTMLAPCIRLTKYVQAGRGKYTDIPTLPVDERSKDAPIDDDNSPHCKVNIDCCTFDRVLLFLTSLLYPEQCKFALDLSEINAMADAAEELGLQPLADLCASQASSFHSRVRRDRYIRFAEVKRRNDDHNELLIILDGMVMDITRWIDEHPGGPSIIPAQALNIDCTIFFEMYHVSRQAFLYLKSFYIGELSPEDNLTLQSRGEGVEASEGFLHVLRSYTDEWRVQIKEKSDQQLYKSL